MLISIFDFRPPLAADTVACASPPAMLLIDDAIAPCQLPPRCLRRFYAIMRYLRFSLDYFCCRHCFQRRRCLPVAASSFSRYASCQFSRYYAGCAAKCRQQRHAMPFDAMLFDISPLPPFSSLPLPLR